MAWDPVSQRCLEFGAQTWSWDGQSWLQHTPAVSPPARSTHQLATDFARSRVVLFGGQSVTTVFQDTWEWNGANWTQRFPATSPSIRGEHAMSWHPALQRVVLHGGRDFGGVLSDTWEWDGTNWLLRATTGPVRHNAGMGPTRDGHVVLFGGRNASTNVAETWTWNGAMWNQASVSPAPPMTHTPNLQFDPVREVTVMCGAPVNPLVVAELWEWDGQGWLKRQSGLPRDAEAETLAADPQRGKVVAFGYWNNSPTTWEWDGSSWLRNAGGGPSHRSGPRMAYAGNGQVMLFGGRSNGISFSETWRWNGAAWALQSPMTSPPGRFDHAMTYDSTRGEVVLFGGLDGNLLPLGDTWTWNGTTWTQRQPATAPSPRSGNAMAEDPSRGVIVMYGGSSSAETWEWNGTNWQLAPVVGGPIPLQVPMLATAPDGQGVLLYGGTNGAVAHTLLWHWNGTTWSQQPITGAPIGNGTLDPVHGHIVLVDDGVWLLDRPTRAEGLPFGDGCVGSAGRPTLSLARDWPFLGNTLSFEVRSVPATAPVVLAFGFTASQFGSVTLPVRLDAHGMPHCWLYISLEADAWLVASGGVATSQLTVPVTPTLIGLEFYAQAAAFDAPANPVGLTVSNAMRLRIGQR